MGPALLRESWSMINEADDRKRSEDFEMAKNAAYVRSAALRPDSARIASHVKSIDTIGERDLLRSRVERRLIGRGKSRQPDRFFAERR